MSHDTIFRSTIACYSPSWVDQLHLHRISATYKFRPNLTYVDLHSQKTKRRPGEEEGTFSDEAEEEEEQEAKLRKGKAMGEAKEVMVSARKTGESKFPTGMSDMRRELLRDMRAEELEPWLSLKYQDEVCHLGRILVLPSLIPP